MIKFKFIRKILLLLPLISFSLSLSSTSAFALKAGDMAPAFTLPNLHGGGTVNLADFRGKVVYVDFWASWCIPCGVSFPLINDMYQKHQGKLAVIGINVDESIEDTKDFLEKYPVSFTLVHDANAQLPEIFGVPKMPSSFVINQQGKIVYAHYGFHPSDMAEIERIVATTIGE